MYIKTLLLVLMAILTGCTATPDADRLKVAAVNYPLAYFAERLGGELVKVEFPAPAGMDPAFWEPDDDALKVFRDADLVLANGADYAMWLMGAGLDEEKVIYTTDAMKDRILFDEQAQRNKSHAYTTWLDFEMATAQARAVYEALLGLMPEHKKELNLRFRQLQVELEGLDRRLINYSKSVDDKALVASYPVYQYFARRYHFEAHSLFWKADKIPTEREWKKLIAILKEHRTRTMLWDAEPLPEVRQELESIGLRVIVYDPCGKRPEKGDFMSVMWENVSKFTGSGKREAESGKRKG